jgi:deoxyribodipyrimidine photo-lyase
MRILAQNSAPVAQQGRYVLYWMTSARRARWNFALDRARAWGRKLGRPVLVLEALRADYPWASERVSDFVEAGMAENERAFSGAGIRYYPFIERRAGEGRGLLEAFARDACAVVTDEFPCLFLPRMVAAAAARVPVRLETVDSNGLLPLRAVDRDFTTAHSFRWALQKALPELLSERPGMRLVGDGKAPVPRHVSKRWPRARPRGHIDPQGAWRGFLAKHLASYGNRTGRTSELSAHLHFGHISPHQLFHELARAEDWSPDRLGKPSGSRAGWWGMSEPAESFLDQLVTWRELGFNMCFHRDDYDRYESLPDWARRTLEKHATDERPHVYTLEQFRNAETHDELWNAAQRQLLIEGRIHNYLRMLWGKKILEWSQSPRAALDIMIELNNRYALDGRDPNSYSGIFWVLGRYDRPWGPERPIFGKVRYMSSANTRRKFPVREYLETYGTGSAPRATPARRRSRTAPRTR